MVEGVASIRPESHVKSDFALDQPDSWRSRESVTTDQFDGMLFAEADALESMTAFRGTARSAIVRQIDVTGEFNCSMYHVIR